MNKKLFEKYIESLPKNSKILDAGCGSGNNSRYVHSIRPDLKIFAIDIDKSKEKEIPKYAKFSNISIEDMRLFKNNTFDCILCFHVLEHLNNPLKAVSEIHRILKKKGVVFAESPHWISTITPIGFNFYDDPTHVRAYNKESFSRLFARFSIKYIKFETPIFFYLDQLYNLNKFSVGYIFRKILKYLGLYRTAVFVIAVKR